MWEKIKERVANLFDFLTSKKALVACGAIAVLLVLVTSVAKIIAVGSVAVAYILAQGYVDAQKELLKYKNSKK